MSKKPIRIEKVGNDGLHLVFSEPMAFNNGDAIVMEIDLVSSNGVIGQVAVRHPVSPSIWTIEYDNDTGPDDDGFAEWWIVTDGERSFTCRKEFDAKWLCDTLNGESK